MDPSRVGARIMIGLPGLTLDKPTARFLRECPPAGVTLFKYNLSPDRAQITELTGALRKISLEAVGRPMIIAVDQEGGTVKRLPPPFGQYPPASSYGREGREAVYRWGLDQGRELKELGFTMNFAPVLDINTLGDEGYMKSRAYGDDPETVAELGAAAVRGLQDAGISACAKHFPGMGQTGLDPHQPVVSEVDRDLAALSEWELVPFKRAIAAGVKAMMTSHLIYSRLDPGRVASLSPYFLHDLPKIELGFQGSVLTDDLEMGAITMGSTPEEAAKEALAAGADLALICQTLDAYQRFVDLK